MDREETERLIRHIVREEIGGFSKSDVYIFDKNIRIGDGRKVIIPGDKGVKFGDSALAKIGFYNTTPVVQQSKINDPGAMGGTYDQNEQISQSDAITNIIDALEALGLTASS